MSGYRATSLIRKRPPRQNFARDERPPPVTPVGAGHSPEAIKAGGVRVWKQEDAVWEWCDAYLVLKNTRLVHPLPHPVCFHTR